MALSPATYSLQNALSDVWRTDELLSSEFKRLILSCLPEENDENCPSSESELDVLQLALNSCDFLSSIPAQEVHWLSEHGASFPSAVRKFLHQVASQFHDTGHELPDTFVEPLVSFINDTNSHVATLNYDNLLYSALTSHHLCSGYNGALVDGFYRAGFDSENLDRRFGRNFGYYMHLHGSPLYVERAGNTVKLRQADSGSLRDLIGNHIVLTHVKHKPVVIGSSEVLSAYWRKLYDALNESGEVYLLGYSGEDDHLNQTLVNSKIVDVKIVEWEGCGDISDRLSYWSERLPRMNVSISHYDSILEFTAW